MSQSRITRYDAIGRFQRKEALSWQWNRFPMNCGLKSSRRFRRFGKSQSNLPGFPLPENAARKPRLVIVEKKTKKIRQPRPKPSPAGGMYEGSFSPPGWSRSRIA
jgi:hypothetical protein